MYEIKLEKKDQLLSGKKQRYIADKLGVTEFYISRLINNRVPISRMIALGIISLCKGISLDNILIEEQLEYYFDEV